MALMQARITGRAVEAEPGVFQQIDAVLGIPMYFDAGLCINAMLVFISDA